MCCYCHAAAKLGLHLKKTSTTKSNKTEEEPQWLKHMHVNSYSSKRKVSAKAELSPVNLFFFYLTSQLEGHTQKNRGLFPPEDGLTPHGKQHPAGAAASRGAVMSLLSVFTVWAESRVGSQ